MSATSHSSPVDGPNLIGRLWGHERLRAALLRLGVRRSLAGSTAGCLATRRGKDVT
jgi:hypothetical protein